MIFSYNWLQSFFGKKLPAPEKLAELLALRSFEVEEVKKSGKDFTLDIDILPNRASDCFSHLGIAKEIAAICNLSLKASNISLKEDKSLKAKDFISVEVKDKTACPRYTARVMEGVKVGPSPKWIQERLKVCGLRPINNIVDIANYVMLETGQPLHAFDGEKLADNKIIVRFAQNRENIVTLDEEKYSLGKDILVIADSKKPIAIAGIKGGKLPEIDKRTKVVVLESANFNPQTVRKGSRRINLRTDASLRFEHGVDANLTEMAINQTAFLIQKVAGGKIAQGLVDVYPKKSLPRKIKLDLNYLNSLLGVTITPKEAKVVLLKLGFKVKEKGRTFFVEVPTIRQDILISENLVEEVGRVYGYEKVKAAFPTVSLIPPEKNLNIFWENAVKDILKEAGLNEVYNYSFISQKDGEMFEKNKLIGVKNPLSVEYKYLRPSLILNLLKNIQKNQKNLKDIRIFELGKVFEGPKKETRRLTGLVQGDAFYQLKGIIDFLLNGLGISDIWYDDHKPTSVVQDLWQVKECAEVKVGQEKIGFLGEISPKIRESLKVEDKVVAFDIDFEKLQTISSEEVIYQPVSKFPAAVRDLAVLVPQGTKVVELLNVMNAAGGKLIRDIDLFDIYEGEELPEGKKNLAFHIIYQAEDRTLKAEEIDNLQKKVIKALEENPEWQVRK